MGRTVDKALQEPDLIRFGPNAVELERRDPAFIGAEQRRIRVEWGFPFDGKF